MNLLVMRSNLLRRRLHRIWSCDQPSCWLFFNQEWNVIWRSDTLMVNALFNVLRGDSGDPRQQDLQQSLLWQPLSKQWCLWAGQVPGLPLSLSPTESWLHLPSRWVHFKILLSNLTVRQEHLKVWFCQFTSNFWSCLFSLSNYNQVFSSPKPKVQVNCPDCPPICL